MPPSLEHLTLDALGTKEASDTPTSYSKPSVAISGTPTRRPRRMTSLITAFVFRYERRSRTLPAHSREHTSRVANSHTVLRVRPMNVQRSSACSSRISKPRNIRWLKRVAAVEARSSHRAMVLRERPVTRAVAEQARDLVELPSTAAKTGVHCPRVRAERLPAHRAAVPPPSARLRGKRAVAHDVEARFSEIVAPRAWRTPSRRSRSSRKCTGARNPWFRPRPRRGR